MYNDPAAEIARAKYIMERLKGEQEKFAIHVAEYPDAEEVSTKLELQGDSLVVNILGYEARSTPRVVANGRDFYLEYVFKVHDREEQIEVARLYLDQDGRLREGFDPEAPSTASRNYYVALEICKRVGFGMLKSPVFAPA